jgi:hypothetical protein
MAGRPDQARLTTGKPGTYACERELNIIRYREELKAHDADLRRRGHDPEYIGSTEVPHPVCPHCRGKLEGYRRN